MPLFSHESIKIFYHDQGSGLPLVLLSGLGGDHQSVWQPCFDELAKKHRIIAVDNRNCGKSQFVEESFTIKDMANDLKSLLDHLNINKCDVVGYSLGGFIAQQFALEYPEAVNRLILACSYSRMSNHLYLYMEAVRIAYEKSRSLQTVFDLVYPFLFRRAYYEESPTGRETIILPQEELQEPFYGWLRQYEAQRAFDSRAWLNKIKQPTLVIGGTEDLLVPMEELEFLCKEIPNAKLIAIKNAGHMVSFEQTSEFTKSILQFLSDRL